VKIDKVTQKVYDFYQECQFNEADDGHQDSIKIEKLSLVTHQLPRLTTNFIESLKEPKIIEAGCGVGWLSISLAKKYPKANVIGIDYSDRAILMANRTLKANRTAYSSNMNVSFIKKNLLLADELKFDAADVVISIGVLHHTSDFKLALLNCAKLLRPGGILFVSLYHKFRRLPFLEYFERLKAKGINENELRNIYFSLDRRSDDPSRMESWFRDQVLHPHESQHTVAETCEILDSLMQHNFNSISGTKIPKIDSEMMQYMVGESNLKKSVYDPGMFYVQLTRRI